MHFITTVQQMVVRKRYAHVLTNVTLFGKKGVFADVIKDSLGETILDYGGL